MKRCASCHQVKPETEFFRYPRTGKLYSYCFDCKRARDSDWHKDRRARRNLERALKQAGARS